MAISPRLVLLATGFYALTLGAQPGATVRPPVVYRNADYGYQVALPAGTAYRMSRAPRPNHGFDVATSAGDTLWVDASYTDRTTLAGVAGEAASVMAGCLVSGERATRLGGLYARELRMRCGEGHSGASAREKREVVALRGGVVYTVGVRRAAHLSPAGLRLFAAARNGFRTTAR